MATASNKTLETLPSFFNMRHTTPISSKKNKVIPTLPTPHWKRCFKVKKKKRKKKGVQFWLYPKQYWRGKEEKQFYIPSRMSEKKSTFVVCFNAFCLRNCSATPTFFSIKAVYSIVGSCCTVKLRILMARSLQWFYWTLKELTRQMVKVWMIIRFLP